MATSTLRAKLRGGTLAKVSDEELQQLSGRAGLDAPPTSPLGAKTLGVGADSAKMAGTPAQRTSALRIGIQNSPDGEAPTNLQDVQRTQQTRSTETAAEKTQKERGGRLAEVEDLGERVQGLASQISQTVAGSDIQNQLALGTESDPSLAEDLALLQSNPADMNNLTAINNKMGRFSTEDMLSAEEILSNYQGIQEQIQGIAGERFAQQSASVKDLDLPALGFQNIEEMADLLGVPVEQLSGMSIDDLINHTQAAVEDEFSRSEDLRAIVSDPSRGPAERAEARKVLKEMGAVGVKGVETELDSIADQIENADTVTFAGEEIPIGNMLNDEYVSGVIANYLLAPEGDPGREALEKSDPELAEWIQNNQESLQGVVENIDQGIRNFASLQEENRRIAQSDVGDIEDSAMEALFEDWGQIRGSRYVSPPALEAVKSPNLGKQERADIVASLNEVAQGGEPDQVRQLATLDSNQLKQVGASRRSSAEWEHTNKEFRVQRDVRRAKNPDELAAAVSDGEYKTIGELQNAMREAALRDSSGLFESSSPLGSIGVDIQPGTNVNNFQSWIQQTADLARTSTLASRLGNNQRIPDTSKVSTFNQQPNDLYSSLAPGAMDDGKIDLDDIPDKTILNSANLKTLLEKGGIAPGTGGDFINAAIDADPSANIGISEMRANLNRLPKDGVAVRHEAHGHVLRAQKELEAIPVDDIVAREAKKREMKEADKIYRSAVINTEEQVLKSFLNPKEKKDYETLQNRSLFGPPEMREDAKRQMREFLTRRAQGTVKGVREKQSVGETI